MKNSIFHGLSRGFFLFCLNFSWVYSYSFGFLFVYNDIKNDTHNKIYNTGDVFSIVYCLISALLYLRFV